MSGHSTAGKTATASLRITLSIPSRARVRTDAAGAETLCLMHIPARFLQVSWRSSGSARSTDTRKPLARLRGNPYVRDCIPLDTARVEKRDRGYLLITAE
ncbi:hypothetical protein [Microbulbifer mangrovi]|uniref:hypothetical protein n=1 Tax=Microbulbifer mangrovi TaxID=927787 RepID=UPI00117C273E|nr:hypothetical protein [Microbulbifer mangrovi]